MNICIESQLLNHPKRSGVMTYTEGLLNGMKANDQENKYELVYYSLKRRAVDMPGPSSPNLKKVIVRVPDRVFAGRQWAIDKIALPLFFKSHKIDVFHRPVGYTMPDSKSVFKILTVHDLRTLTIGDQYAAQHVDNYKKVFEKINMCVVVSECTKRDLIDHFDLDEKKIKVVYLGADDRYCVLPGDKVNAVKEKFKIDKPYLLSVGSVPRKNIDGIIKGFAGSKYRNDFQLVLGCSMDVEKYKEQCRGLGIENNVLFITNVSDEDMTALFNGCHCFVFPSLYEGFGLPILEAMQCGAPVITSDISSCPEVAAEAAFLVDPKNTGEISNAIDQMCSDNALRESFIAKGFERAKMFSWDKFANQMKDIYSRI